MAVDTLGRPPCFIVTAGQVGDITQAPVLSGWPDKAYDSKASRETIADMGAEVVILSNHSRKVIIPHHELVYKHRNRIERCFNRMKHCRFARAATVELFTSKASFISSPQ